MLINHKKNNCKELYLWSNRAEILIAQEQKGRC